MHQLMMLMIDSYLDIVEYFDTGQDKAKAVKAVKKLIVYAGLIANFEPPKNTGKIEEYTAMQTQFTEILTKFADELQKSGISDETRQQWKAVVEIVNQAHRKFSDEEIDLGNTLKEFIMRKILLFSCITFCWMILAELSAAFCAASIL